MEVVLQILGCTPDLWSQILGRGVRIVETCGIRAQTCGVRIGGWLGPSHPGDSGIDSRLGEGKGGMRRVIGLVKNGRDHAKFLKLWTEW